MSIRNRLQALEKKATEERQQPPELVIVLNDDDGPEAWRFTPGHIERVEVKS